MRLRIWKYFVDCAGLDTSKALLLPHENCRLTHKPSNIGLTVSSLGYQGWNQRITSLQRAFWGPVIQPFYIILLPLIPEYCEQVPRQRVGPPGKPPPAGSPLQSKAGTPFLPPQAESAYRPLPLERPDQTCYNLSSLESCFQIDPTQGSLHMLLCLRRTPNTTSSSFQRAGSFSPSHFQRLCFTPASQLHPLS